MSWVTSKCTVHERAEPKTPWNSAAVHYLCRSQLGLFLVPQDDLASCSHVYSGALLQVDPLGEEVLVFPSLKPILFVVHNKALAARSTALNSIFPKEGDRLHVLAGAIKKAMVVSHSSACPFHCWRPQNNVWTLAVKNVTTGIFCVQFICKMLPTDNAAPV